MNYRTTHRYEELVARAGGRPVEEDLIRLCLKLPFHLQSRTFGALIWNAEVYSIADLRSKIKDNSLRFTQNLGSGGIEALTRVLGQEPKMLKQQIAMVEERIASDRKRLRELKTRQGRQR